DRRRLWGRSCDHVANITLTQPQIRADPRASGSLHSCPDNSWVRPGAPSRPNGPQVVAPSGSVAAVGGCWPVLAGGGAAGSGGGSGAAGGGSVSSPGWSTVGSARRADSVEPALASTTTPTATAPTGPSGWLSSTHPASAAIAGSRLSSTPNTCGCNRRRAASSSEYGTTEASSAVPAASSSECGRSSACAAPTAPNGSSASAPTAVAMASPPCPGT